MGSDIRKTQERIPLIVLSYSYSAIGGTRAPTRFESLHRVGGRVPSELNLVVFLEEESSLKTNIFARFFDTQT
jgi:hypothetical protein